MIIWVQLYNIPNRTLFLKGPLLTHADETSTSVSGKLLKTIIKYMELDAINVLKFMATVPKPQEQHQPYLHKQILLYIIKTDAVHYNSCITLQFIQYYTHYKSIHT